MPINKRYSRAFVPISLALFLIAPLVSPAFSAETKLNNFSIPAKFGYISKTSFRDAPSGKTVLYIQDLHADYTAQKNIAAMLEGLIKNNGIKVVLVEGGSGDDSLAYMRDYATSVKIKEVAEQYLRNGDISGEEYLSLISNEEFRILGIENPALYDNHMRSFLEISSIKDKSLAALDEFTRLEDTLKDKVYNAQLKEFERSAGDFDKGALALADYIKGLNKEAKAKNVDYSGLSQFRGALRLVTIEGDLDLAKVEAERAALIQEVVKVAPRETTDALTAKADDFKADKISPNKFYSFLKSVSADTKIDLKTYPDLAKYCDYLETADKINHEALFDEIDALREKVREQLFGSDDEKKLYLVSSNTAILKGLISTKLRPVEYEKFRREKTNFNLTEWASFLNSLAARNGISSKITSDFSIAADNLYTFENYYVLAKERDIALAENIEKRMKEENVNQAVVIAGGFHADELLELLKKRGFSYALISPNIGNDPKTKDIYVRKLVEKWNPGEWGNSK